MLPIRELFSTNKKEKDAAWFNRIATFCRLNWVPLISQNEAERGMAYLFGYQDMSPIQSLFQNLAQINLGNETATLYNGLGQPINPTNKADGQLLHHMSNVGFKSLPIWEKRYNVLISEMKKMGVIVDVRSADPTSKAKRKADKKLIKNKKEIESFVNYIYTSIGQAPYRMEDHEARFGEKLGNGNTHQFDEMGMDSGDKSDVNFFMDFFHKLREEIAVQDIIEYISSDNQWNLDIEKWVRDIIAKKACCATSFVSNTTGKITTRYLAPETIYIYGGGNRQDFNDANAKGYERKVSIKEMLEIIGNSFDMEKEWSRLLQAITYTSQVEWTGVKPSYRGFITGDMSYTHNGKNQGYNDFMALRVAIGRIEVNSQNEETFGNVSGKSEGFYENNQSPDGKYPSRARWETPTYKAYYIVVSQMDQILFDFGELEYQDILGATDMNVWSTIVTYKGVGDSLTIQSAQIVDRINEAWYKFIYEMRRAKPRGRGYNFRAMMERLMNSFPNTTISDGNKFMKILEMVESSANEVWDFPIGEDGKEIMMPGNQLNYDIPGGMSKESMLWWQIMMENLQYLDDMIGIAPLREGNPGNPRDSMNNQFKALEYSQAATYYIPDMLTYLFEQLAVKSTFFAQDIITYKDYNTMAYKALEDAVGSETLETIAELGKTAMHRFGIYVESMNQEPLRQEVNELVKLAIQNKTITTAESLLIRDEKNPKKAYVTLAYFEQRNRKLAEKQAQQAQQAQMQQAMGIEQMRQKSEMIKGDYAVMVAKINAEATQNTHAITGQTQLAKQQMKISGDSQQIYEQAHADLLKEQQINTKAQSQPTPNIPQPPLPPAPNTGLPQQEQPSNIEQLRNATIPQNTMQAQ